ncbi:KAP family P-loop NTPase fold protein [Vibrio alginolyticus]|uniref:KAP family P-loop NTPase fold protein n=1 Tax=Vibrio alginolyticus TaxID=663 RepID=UPI001BD2D0D2|nr:P-loop NTPase fold protein [Vibrio alginolyticus]ELB1089322.1 hypothetical protein [Vibrio alginolyticus]ELB1661630.1 hypothetical protein [Vibrio alginolyticus]MBS9868214.1 hypothetical protein [Vibrio alginolyticus]MBT0066719.1 hypothetical protein [Vibrio alginolyticus]HCZ9286605.1 hypothetical protein [Vibrio alginolyticus]
MSDLHQTIRLEQNGLCAISGEPLSENFHIQSLDPINMNAKTLSIFGQGIEHLIGILPEVNTKIGRQLDELAVKWSLPGMRDNGQVKLIDTYFIAEYENRYLRLEELKLDLVEIGKLVNKPFVIYDYKATIRSDCQQALDYLNKKYKGDLDLEHDTLSIDDYYISTKPLNKQSYVEYAKELWNHLNNIDQTDISKAEHSLPVEIVSTVNFQVKEKANVNSALGVDSVSDLLAEISPELIKDSGMMVGIFGHWGRGKTFLANKIISKIKSINSNWYSVNFSAWKYQNTESSWSYLHDNILIELERDKSLRGRAKNFANRVRANGYKKGMFGLCLNIILIIALAYWVFFVNKVDLILAVASVITTATIIFFVKTFIFFNSSSGYFKKIKKDYFGKNHFRSNLGIQAEIEESLVAMLKSWIPEHSKSKLVLFVDDIDRCDVKNVLDVIDGLRLILDNPEIYKRVIIISAIDERILQHAIRIKYQGDNKLSLSEIYAEYLQKIFIIGIKLEQLCEEESKEFFERLLPDYKDCYSIFSFTEFEAKDSTPELTETSNEYALNPEGPTNNSEQLSSTNSTSTQDSENLAEDESEKEITEISKSEHDQLMKSIVNLKERTPRSIKIFYYKYLISKKLLIESLREKQLLNKWNESKHEEQLIEHLIAIANAEPIQDVYKNKHPDVDEIIKKAATLVSAI